MKGKISFMWRATLALVLVLSLGVVMATPVAASHTSSATVAFHAGESQLVDEASVLDVVVTNADTSLGKIKEVEIDFSLTDFTSIGKGVEPANWTGVVEDSVITYTAAAGAEIAADASLTFYPTVTNPEESGVVDPNPTVTTSDPGNKAVLTTGSGTTEISYVADVAGAGGNDITIAYVDPAGAGTLSVAVAVKAITVTLAHDGAALTSTANEVVAAIEADGDASALVDASTTQVGIIGAMSSTPLADGEPEVDKTCSVTGSLDILEFGVTATSDDYGSSKLANYTISFTTLTEIVATTGTITLTFPSGYAISLLVEGDITMTVAGSAYTPLAKTIDAVARTVTITANGVIAVDKAVVVTIANDHVKNPPTSGTYDIAVLTSGPDSGSGEVTIIPASFNVVAGTSNTVTAATAFAVTISALNADAGSDTGYAGSHFIDFTSGGTGTIPAFELISFTAGVGTSPQNFILTVAGEAAVTIAATDESSITGTSAAITINPAGLASFDISGEPGSVTAGEDFDTADITVTAKDAGGYTKTDYVGTVTWTSTDELAVLPADYTFTSEDAGEYVFLGSEFILKTVGGGTQTITVADEAAVVEVESGGITVTAAAATALVVAVDVDVIRANGTDPSEITASAVDPYGNVDTSYTAAVIFTASLGTLSAVDTDFTSGVATATLKSSDVGTAIIKVTSAGLPSVYVMTTVKLLPLIGIDSIVVTVDKTTILNNGADERTITATYLDSGSDVVTAAAGADYTVTFTTDDVADPPEVTLNPADGVVVPVAGVATVTLTTTLASPDTILVTATGTGVTDDLDVPIDVNEGTFAITLFQGWNLISLPLIPVDDSVEMVLAGLITADTVIQVQTYNASDGIWSKWASTGPYALNPTLTDMNDGPGFWVEMSAGDTLTATGCVVPLPPGTPRSYSVYTGWNLIGFKSLAPTLEATLYLGQAVMLTFEMMYDYDADTGLFEGVMPLVDFLVPGQGYWLAVNAPGTIYP